MKPKIEYRPAHLKAGEITSYDVVVNNCVVGQVGRYARQRTWFLRSGEHVYSSGLRNREEATRNLMSVPEIRSLWENNNE